MSTVPTATLGDTGYVEPAESAVLSAVLTDINTAFGGTLNASPTSSEALATPQGQLASSVTAYITDTNDLFAYFVTQVDPQYAQGSMQDAIGNLYFQTRFPATSTAGPCTCTGLPGTVIPVNAQAQDLTTGDIYLCQDGGTIPGGGSITLTFANQTTGPRPCLAGNLNQIYVAVPGWSGITNPADLPEGTNVESSQDFELRRQASVASNALGNLASIRAAVIASGSTLDPPVVPTSVYVTENFTNVPTVMGGVILAPHSLYVAALGGDPQSICDAIWSKKSVGCSYNGNTTMTVEDKSLLSPPYPTYQVTYEQPSQVPIYFQVTIRSSPNLPSTIVQDVKNCILNLFATPNNTTGGIGTTTDAGDFYGPITALNAFTRVYSVMLGTSASAVNQLAITTNINQYPYVPLDGHTISVSIV
jgi:hypothetical protein